MSIFFGTLLLICSVNDIISIDISFFMYIMLILVELVHLYLLPMDALILRFNI
jgi:hypothetical protein